MIQVDVDSTLYPSDILFYEIAKKYDVKWPKVYSYWFGPEDIGTDLKTLKQIFREAHSREVIMTTKPYPDAVEVLAELVQDYEVEIAYVSDRNEQQSAALKEWLDVTGFLTSPEQHVEATKDKRHWMREHKPEIVVDDRVRTLLMTRFELGSYGVSLEHPYNVNLKGEVDGIYIVKDWHEIDVVLRELVHDYNPVSRTKELEGV